MSVTAKTQRAVLDALRNAGGDWVDVQELRRVGGGEHADRRVRELRKMGHSIDNRLSPMTHRPEYALRTEAAARCGDCGQQVGHAHARNCVMKGYDVMPGHCPV